MLTKKICIAFLFLWLNSCAGNGPRQNLSPDDNETVISDRQQAVSFFAGIYKTYRDTERSIDNLQYDIRDGIDNFIYDVEKDYYNDYQK
ncbi:MAG: hypothetical protein WC782_09355 [Methylococcaceae bacterium]|jgi:hypothetical protein